MMNTGSIGIIGGADGPTSIFVSAPVSPALITMAIIFLAIIVAATALITCFICRRKYRKEAKS